MSFFKKELRVVIGSAAEEITIKTPLNITATVVKDIKTGEEDYAQVIIYNLKHNTRDALNKDYQNIHIVGGYNGALDSIFTGSIVSAHHTHVGTDWITVLECGDGAFVLSKALINKTYAKGFSLGDIIEDFAVVSEVALAEMIGIDETKTLSRGRVFSADMKTSLDELGKANNFDWSIQDGELVVVKDGSGRDNVSYLISSRSGMVGSPEWINTGNDVSKTEGQQGLKYKVNSLCLPSLKPADLIVVESKSLQGRIGDYHYNIEKEDFRTEFIVSKVQHNLNNRDGDFHTQIECVSREVIL